MRAEAAAKKAQAGSALLAGSAPFKEAGPSACQLLSAMLDDAHAALTLTGAGQAGPLERLRAHPGSLAAGSGAIRLSAGEAIALRARCRSLGCLLRYSEANLTLLGRLGFAGQHRPGPATPYAGTLTTNHRSRGYAWHP